jgi:hypothetical protein
VLFLEVDPAGLFSSGGVFLCPGPPWLTYFLAVAAAYRLAFHEPSATVAQVQQLKHAAPKLSARVDRAISILFWSMGAFIATSCNPECIAVFCFFFCALRP